MTEGERCATLALQSIFESQAMHLAAELVRSCLPRNKAYFQSKAVADAAAAAAFAAALLGADALLTAIPVEMQEQRLVPRVPLLAFEL